MQPLPILGPIMLNDLFISNIHHLQVAIVRTITEPNFNRYLCAGIEDVKGNVTMVLLHNTDPSLKKEDILPKDLVLAIKEPYFEMLTNGMYGIVIENISDLIELDVDSSLMPSEWRRDALAPYSSDPSQLKIAGNIALSRKDFIKAARHYTMGISLCKSSQRDVRQHLLRNRALVNIYLGRYQQAREDALASIIQHQQGVAASDARTLDTKAYFRAARASYHLAQFDEARRYLDKALILSPGDSDILRELNQTQARISESQHGEYDFDALSRSTQHGKPRIDAANFVSNTEIKNFGDSRGRGLIATKDIQMGELVMCEKAFCAAFAHDVLDHAHVNLIANSHLQQVSSYRTARLTPMAIHKILHNGCVAEPFLNLWAPEFPTVTRGGVAVDSQTMVSSLFVDRAIKLNHFDLPPCMADLQISMMPGNVETVVNTITKSSTGPTSSGIFLRASLFNHSCAANAVNAFVGDLIIIHASKNIKKGEEITIAYTPREPNFQKKLEEWGFVCTCAHCKADAQHPHATIEERGKLLLLAFIALTSTLMSTSSSHRAGSLAPPDRELKRLYIQLKLTYNPSICGNLPYLGLVHIDMLRAKLCAEKPDGADVGLVLYHSLACLRNTGLVVNREKDALSVDASNYVHSCYTVDALMHAAMACKKLGKAALCDELTKLAQLMWKIHTGATVGFDEKYANVPGM